MFGENRGRPKKLWSVFSSASASTSPSEEGTYPRIASQTKFHHEPCLPTVHSHSVLGASFACGKDPSSRPRTKCQSLPERPAVKPPSGPPCQRLSLAGEPQVIPVNEKHYFSYSRRSRRRRRSTAAANSAWAASKPARVFTPGRRAKSKRICSA